MNIERYVELRLIEAFEYTKYSNEDAWSFVVRVHDKNINFTGNVNESEQKETNKEQIVKLFTETLIKMEFSIDELHIKELIDDLRKVKLFGLVNECISALEKLKLLSPGRGEEIKSRAVIFTNLQTQPSEVLHYGHYHPYRGGANPDFDDFSSKILDLKNNYDTGVNYFYNLLRDYYGGNFTIVIIPSHDPEKLISGIKRLAIKFATNNITIIDGTSCLVRTAKIDKLATGGNRDLSVQLNSMEVRNSRLVRDRNILLLDDVTTTNNSLIAGRTLLLNAGATLVQAFAIAQTN